MTPTQRQRIPFLLARAEIAAEFYAQTDAGRRHIDAWRKVASTVADDADATPLASDDVRWLDATTSTLASGDAAALADAADDWLR